VACGVPISAADLALTPTVSPQQQRDEVSQRAVLATPTLTAVGTIVPGSAASLVAPTEIASPTDEPEATEEPEIEVAAAVDTPTAQEPTPEPPSISAAGGVEEAVAYLNEYRASLGLSQLSVNGALMTAAGNYAQLMATYNWFYCSCDFHYGPDGSSPSSRIAAAGYSGRYLGEALAGGQGSARSVINGWLNSPAHAAILLNPNAVEVGIGHAYTSGDAFHHYWSLVTGRP
jgi:uncharacterized protein YkwD